MKNQKSSELLSKIKMGELTLLDAMLFQEVLARSDPEIATLASSLSQQPVKVAFADAWETILGKNYVPIFKMAHNLIIALPASPGVEDALKILALEAQKIASSRALLRHDLMGRIYHRLLMSDIAKYQATYYTSVPSAYLLARFSLDAPNDQWQFDWADIDSIATFKAGDLACGSGTLLSATYSAILDKHITSSAKQDLDAFPKELHKVMLEKILLGLDVLSFAAHLSAVTLALHNPSSIFSTTGIYALPLTGKGDKPRLGSIDLLESSEINPSYLASPTGLQGEVVAPEQKGIDQAQASQLKVEPLDLIIMNPPFTRSVIGNLLFGALPDAERKVLQPHLQKVLKQKGFSGIGQAGLGAVFIVVANKYLQSGGRLALVIPRSLLSGIAWRKIRELLAESYETELIIASHQAPDGWNFSENTKLSEILLVARKHDEVEETPVKTIIANLWRKPRNEMESIVLSGKLTELSKTLAGYTSAYDVLENGNASHLDLLMGEEKLGEAYAVSASLLADALDTWGQLAPFAESPLNRLAYLFVTSGHCVNPQIFFPLLNLSQLAKKVGPDIRQVRGAFNTSSTPTTFRALWNHNSQYVTKMAVNTNQYLQPKPGAMKPAESLWSEGRGRLMVANRLRLNTHKLVATYIQEKALGSMWWPVCLKEPVTKDDHEVTTEQHEHIQTLWLNATFGLLGILAMRQDTEGPWIQLKKEALENVPFLDVAQLNGKQVNSLLELYSKASVQELPPLPIQFQQAAQKQGWRYEVDKALIEIVTGEAKDLTPIYEMLAREPIICLKPLA